MASGPLIVFCKLSRAILSGIASAVLSLMVWPSTDGAFAQTSSDSPTVAPKLFGYDIPEGDIRPGGATVETRDDDGRIAVTKVHVDVGEYRILLMPDGQLISRRRDQTRATTSVEAHAIDINTIVSGISFYSKIHRRTTIDTDIVTETLDARITPAIDIPFG